MVRLGSTFYDCCMCNSSVSGEVLDFSPHFKDYS